MSDATISVDSRIGSDSCATTNACKLCTPLGACLAFLGVEGGIPFLHGSQGCATYIRRYLISHFREPVDIASSNFSESAAVFGGEEVFATGMTNVARRYRPSLIGVATTCLSETIGDDVPRLVARYLATCAPDGPEVVRVSTPAYSGTHAEGFHAAVLSLVEHFAEEGPRLDQVNLMPGMVSPADLRYLEELFTSFGLSVVILPNYANSLDGPIDGTPSFPTATTVEAIRSVGRSRATLELGATLGSRSTAGSFLEARFGVPLISLGLPIGISSSDELFRVLEKLAGRETPSGHLAERGRLVDAYVDGHKYLAGKRVCVYGEEDLVAALAGFFAEIGIEPALCVSGGSSGVLAQAINDVASCFSSTAKVMENTDLGRLEELVREDPPDIMVGHSKGYRIARAAGLPLLRLGFPIHDRIGAQRLLHLGYRGTQELFDRLVNALLEAKQEASSVGYSYL
jgi:nitrogenase molybdenum-iron protein NifN